MEYLLYLIILARISFITTEEYTITRPSWHSEDKVKLPSSQCTSDWKEKCKNMGGVATWQNCVCKCSIGKHNVFGYFYNSWKCTSNEELRQTYSECVPQPFFQEQSNSVIRVVKTGNNQRFIEAFEFSKNCTNLESQISYLKCNGEWQRFNQSSSDGFYLIENFAESTDDLYHKGRDKLEKYKPTVFGRIIKLTVICYDYNHDPMERCVLLKVQGQQNCQVDLLPTTSHSSRTTATHTTNSSTSAPSRSSSTTSQTVAAKRTESLSTTVTSTTRQQITNTPQKQEDQANRSDRSVGAIGGAISGAATLIIIGLIILIALLRRRKRYHEEKEESTNAPSPDNPSYNNTIQIKGQLDVTDNEYSYAYTSNQPIAIKDQNCEASTGPGVEDGHSVVLIRSPPEHQVPFYHSLEDTGCLQQEKSCDQQNELPCNAAVNPKNTRITDHGPVYDVLEGPSNNGGAPNTDSSIYNTLQDPNYEGLKLHIVDYPSAYNVLTRDQPINMQNGRVYDVLKYPNPPFNAHGCEAPTYEELEGRQAPNTTEGPVYDILEDPNSVGSQVYNTLEGPSNIGQQTLYRAPLKCQDSSVYGSQKDQSPKVYGHLYSPILKAAENSKSFDNDIYQEFNQAGQMPSPLRHKRNSIILKNMTRSNQSNA